MKSAIPFASRRALRQLWDVVSLFGGMAYHRFHDLIGRYL